MPIRKDKKSGIWHLDIRTPGGQRIRRSTETTDRKAAQEYHDRLKADLWRQDKLGDIPDRTFEEAAVRFLHECEGQRDYATKLRHVAYWRKRFSGRPVRCLRIRSSRENRLNRSLAVHAIGTFSPSNGC
jgi:hypothetical protein